MPYGPHTDRRPRADAGGARHRQRSTSCSRTSRPSCAPRRSTCRRPSRSSSWPPGCERLAGAQPDRPRALPGGRRLPPLEPARGRPAPARAASGTRPTRRTSPRSARARSRRIYEYESLLAELVDLDVVSASHYDGAAATAEAALMTCRATRRERVLVVARRPPALPGDDPRPTSSGGLELEEIPLVTDGEAAGTTDLAALERLLADPDRPVAGVIAGQPDFLGLLEPMPEIGRAGPRRRRAVRGRRRAGLAGRPGAARRVRRGHRGRRGPAARASRRSTAARTWASSPRPRRWSARSPAGWSGMTTDLDGQRAFVMTLRAREQDIRRDKAASNICTNQALLRPGRVDLPRDDRPARPARRGGRSAPPAPRELEAALAAVGARAAAPGPYLNEFAVRVPDARGRPSPRCSSAASWPACPGRRGARRPDAGRRPAGVRHRGHHARAEIARVRRSAPGAAIVEAVRRARRGSRCRRR